MTTSRASRRTQVTAEVMDAWLASLASAHTRAAYRADLADFAAWCAQHRRTPLQVDRTTVVRYHAEREANGTSAASVARGRSALNGFFRFASSNGAAEVTVHDDRPRRAPVISSTVPLTPAEREALLARAPTMSTKSRVLVALLLLEGLRLDEVLQLDVEHVAGKGTSRTIALRRAQGEQVVTLHPDTARALDLHLRRHGSGPLLTSDSRSRTPGGRLTRFGADYLIKKAGRDAGLPTLTANSLRRTHVVHAHRHGRSLDDIRRQLGHDDIRTTRRYLLPDDGAHVPETHAGAVPPRRRPDPRR